MGKNKSNLSSHVKHQEETKGDGASPSQLPPLESSHQSLATSPGLFPSSNVFSLTPLERLFRAITFLATVAVLLFFCTVPVGGDPDMWWQMALGRDIIQRRTLVTDHSLYSWTPASNKQKYCAWIGQLTLYFTHELFGIPGLQILRYLVFLASWLAFLWFAKQRESLWHPLVWILPLLCFLKGMDSATLVKPEMFSYLFFTLLLGFWVLFKQGKASSWRWAYAIPCLMLVWVNTHGAFVFGAIFLFLATVGEFINLLFHYERRLEIPALRHWFIAMLLSAVAIFLTPYGFEYIKVLAISFLEGSKHSFAVVAYISVFNPASAHLRLGELYFTSIALLFTLVCMSLESFRRLVRWILGLYWIVFIPFIILLHLDPARTGTYLQNSTFQGMMAISLVLLGVALIELLREKRFDFSVWLPLAFLGCFSTVYLRAVYLGAVVICFGAFMLVDNLRDRIFFQDQRLRQWIAAGIALFTLSVASLWIFTWYHNPLGYRWTGWGTDCWAPIEEVEYLIQNYPEIKNVGNIYELGGYMIWRFNRERKVLMDPRAFPYDDWFYMYRNWEIAQDWDFVKKFPADAWFISYRFPHIIQWFLRSPDYKLAFYSGGCTLFLKSHIPIPDAPSRMGEGAIHLKSPTRTLEVINLALNLNDYIGVKRCLQALSQQQGATAQNAREALKAYLHGQFAFQTGDYPTAIAKLQEARRSGVIANDALLAQAYFHVGQQLWSAGKDREAYLHFCEAEKLNRTNFETIYNTALTAWQLYIANGSVPASEWKDRLERLVREGTAVASTDAYKKALEVSQAILHGEWQGRPPLLQMNREPTPLTPVQQELLPFLMQ